MITPSTEFWWSGKCDIRILVSSCQEISPGHPIITTFVPKHAYQTLGLLKRTYSSSLPVNAKKQLYISLVRSQLLYCSLIWHPHFIKDIKSLKWIRRRATNFILGTFSLNYKERLVALKPFPLMYFLERNDLFFFLSNLKFTPTSLFLLALCDQLSMAN